MRRLVCSRFVSLGGRVASHTRPRVQNTESSGTPLSAGGQLPYHRMHSSCFPGRQVVVQTHACTSVSCTRTRRANGPCPAVSKSRHSAWRMPTRGQPTAAGGVATVGGSPCLVATFLPHRVLIGWSGELLRRAERRSNTASCARAVCLLPEIWAYDAIRCGGVILR